MQLEAVKTAAASPFQTAANYLFSSSGGISYGMVCETGWVFSGYFSCSHFQWPSNAFFKYKR
jgi:hypothetical protein